MTAPESRHGTGHRTPSDDALRTMRDAVLRVWRDADAGAPAVDAAVWGLCQEAHARGMGAEDVILAMKALIGGIPELREPTRREDAVRLQDTLVTHCIKCYYAG